ncbi:MAG: DUF4129 domain-containing protein, partial [Actinomycetota bacterium]|nr:DUF4129 domain-containing protein [Actinomycetota bacterium]
YRRRELLAAARTGDATAAWRSVQDIAIDLMIPLPAGETPRSFGQRMIAEHGAPAEQMWTLIRAIERASYSGRDVKFGPDLADTVSEVRTGMLAAVPRARRIVALVLPRSLIVRPGSAFSTGGERVRLRV